MSENKRAIVTGGTRGIGRAIVKELASRSCCGVLFSDVAFIYNSCDECVEEIKKEIKNPATQIYGFKADASSFEQAQATVKNAIEKLGGVDILVNNAGITRDNLLLRMTPEEFDAVINVNLKSVFNYTKAVIPHMIKQRYGKIVNIASVVGLIGNPGQSNYAASKAGIIGFTRSVAREVASRNITVNAVAPGFIETEMTGKLNEKQKETLLQNIPIKRFGQPEDVAKLVGFLCSDRSRLYHRSGNQCRWRNGYVINRDKYSLYINTGGRMSLEEKIRDIIVDKLGVTAEKVKPEAHFIDDLGADSLDTVELVMAFEEEFHVEIPDDDAQQITTVKGAIDYLSKKLGE